VFGSKAVVKDSRLMKIENEIKNNVDQRDLIKQQ
jgi:hypothetical protein